MILTINTEDIRDVKALQLAATADQWTELPLGGFRVEVTVHRFPDADASPPRGIGGSGAGSPVVTLDLSELAQDVVTSEWLAEVKAKFTKLQMDLAQSRATEAELRALLREVRGSLICVCGQRPHSERCIVSRAKAALDAAEQPARAEGGQG